MTVSKAASQCADLLAKVHTDKTLSPKLRLSLDDVLARLKIWAGNVGAFAPGNASIDYRLREDTDVVEILVSMLSSLRICLENAVNPSVPEEAEDEVIESQAEDEVTESQESKPTDIGTESQSSASSALSRDSETGGSGRSDPEDDNGPEACVRKANDIINRLYRLASVLRRPASSSENTRVREFIAKRKDDGDIEELEDVEDHARSHVLARFPQTPQYLQDRLVAASIFRRMKLRYRQRHQDKLRQGIDSLFELDPQRRATSATEKEGAAPFPLRRLEPQGKELPANLSKGKALPKRAVNHAMSATNASSINRPRLVNYAKSVALSGITRSAAARHQKLDVPSPPLNWDERLQKAECSFCFRMISKQEMEGPHWT